MKMEYRIYKTPQIKKTKTLLLLMGGVKLLLLEKAYILYYILYYYIYNMIYI